MNLDQARGNIGRDVLYTPSYGATEIGRIYSVHARGTGVFVLYLGDVGAKLTDPKDLRLIRRIYPRGLDGPPRWEFVE